MRRGSPSSSILTRASGELVDNEWLFSFLCAEPDQLLGFTSFKKRGFGNYDINVIMKAVIKRDFVVHWYDARKGARNIRTDLVFGFIINTNGWFGRHWSALRQFDGDWYNLDSKLSAPKKFENLDAVSLFFFFFFFLSLSHFNPPFPWTGDDAPRRKRPPQEGRALPNHKKGGGV